MTCHFNHEDRLTLDDFNNSVWGGVTIPRDRLFILTQDLAYDIESCNEFQRACLGGIEQQRSFMKWLFRKDLNNEESHNMI